MGKTERVKIQPGQVVGKIDKARVDATTEAEVLRHMQEDETQARLDAAKYARKVRKKLGLNQKEFARRIHVSVETVRNWEQGKRVPTGAAQALLRVLDKAPEAALMALELP